MSYIDNWFHFYSTTESFEVHRKQGLINPDSICFLKETGQIYTQNSFFGICRERYEKLEQLVLDHDAKIKDILGIEGPSVKDGIVNNIADLVNFLDGFTDEDNLKDFLDAMRTALENQISAVNKALSDRITALEDEIHNDSESLHNAINAINSQIETIDIRLDNHDTAISALNTSLASHIREYNLLKTNYENFKAYAETKFTAIDSSISSINISIATLQQEFTNLDEKFDDVENEVSEVKALLEDAKLLVRELEDRFGETLAAIEQFKKDVNDEIDDFKALVGAPNGMAPLDGDAKVPAAYLPSYVDDVLEYATRAAFPVTGETGKIYVSLDDNLTYRWSGSTYIEISKSLGLGETTTTAYPGNKGKKNADDIAAHKADTNNPHNVTKAQLGLDKVNNTSDEDKPVSTAQAAAIKVVQDDLTSHKGNKANPHEVTKAQVGLSNVDNTADLDKPISKATQAALDVLDTSLDTHIADKTNPHNVTKEQLGLGNVENTADKDKPISDAAQNVLDTKVDKIVGKGLSTNDFTNEDKAKLDRATTVNDEGKISAELIPVDEEDLTVHSITDTNKVIRLKDRDTTNGMGYKILRLSEELDNILTQDMISEPNTIYEIRYDFDLAGANITIPANCVLKFEGGSLDNGTIEASNTVVEGQANCLGGTLRGMFTSLNLSWIKNKTNSNLVATRILNVDCDADVEAVTGYNNDIIEDYTIIGNGHILDVNFGSSPYFFTPKKNFYIRDVVLISSTYSFDKNRRKVFVGSEGENCLGEVIFDGVRTQSNFIICKHISGSSTSITKKLGNYTFKNCEFSSPIEGDFFIELLPNWGAARETPSIDTILIEGCKFYGVWGWVGPISIQGAIDNLKIHNCIFSSPSSPNYNEAQVDNLEYSNCIMFNVGTQSQDTEGRYNNKKAVIRGCSFINKGTGLIRHNGYKNVVVQNCTFDSERRIEFNGIKELYINSCVFTGNTDYTDNSRAVIISDVEDLCIYGCTFGWKGGVNRLQLTEVTKHDIGHNIYKDTTVVGEDSIVINPLSDLWKIIR